MMRASESNLMAEDVTIRCRVRRSPHASNPKFEEAVEMTCTMKNWDACAKGIPARRNPLSYSLPQRAVSAPHPSRTPTPPGRQHVPGSSSNGGGILSKSLNIGGGGLARVAPHPYGPELLLTPVRELLTNRDDSPLQKRVSISMHQQNNAAAANAAAAPAPAYAYSIPISDVMIVDTANPTGAPALASSSPGRKCLARHHGSSQSSSSSCQLFITTFSYGLLDFQCQHQNGLDILMAFLKASLPPERILDRAKYLNHNNHSSYDESSSLDSLGTSSDNDDPGRQPLDPNSSSQQQQALAKRRRGRKPKNGRGGGPTIRSSSSVTSCLDVDTFTAVHLKGRADHETWPEKVTRRVGHVVNSLSDLSSACCDGSWCLATTATTSTSAAVDDERDDHHHHHHRHAPASSSMRPMPPQEASTRSSLRLGSSRAAATSDASGISSKDPPPPTSSSNSPPPPQKPSSQPFHYSDLELDEQESQLPVSGPDPRAASTNTPPPANADRRSASMPSARRLELARKSSC